jgi:RNA polymerase primary sigma factor
MLVEGQEQRRRKQNQKTVAMPSDLKLRKPVRGLATLWRDEPYFAGQKPTRTDLEDRPEGDGDIGRMYFREMGKVPLLTREREIELARRIQLCERKIHKLLQEYLVAVEEMDPSGQKLGKDQSTAIRSTDKVMSEVVPNLDELVEDSGDDRNRFRGLTADLKRAEADLRAARAEMVEANLRLVVSVAKRYTSKGLSFLDLIQEGNLGLVRAAEKYDFRKESKFSTYAHEWIRRTISRALVEKSKTIRIPIHMQEKKNRVSEVFHRSMKKGGREPLSEEIASEAGIDPDKVQKVMSLSQEAVSLETPVGDDGKLQDLIRSEERLSLVQDLVESMDFARKTQGLLSLLSPREEQILRLRFGIGESTPHTLSEVGKRFGITREWVRQIQRKALEKLSRKPRAKAYIEDLRRSD